MAAWHTTGDMVTSQGLYPQYTATLLLDGRVLVVGGRRSTEARESLASAELYDPASGRWTATGSLAQPRYLQTATLLRDGKVLVAGGQPDDLHLLASAELYDPGTGRWSVTGSLHEPRSGHTATLLPNGKVLVAGGVDMRYQSAGLTTAEVYDPGRGQWSPAASMSVPRGGHTATLLPDGRVLVAGGDGGDGGRTAELYDPASGRWTATGSMADARHGHAATLLPDGRVLVTGGFYGTGYAIGPFCEEPGPCSAELYDPSSGRWSATGSLHADRVGHAATLLPDGTVLVIGAPLAPEPPEPLAPEPTELYRPGTGTWTFTARPAKTGGLTATLLLDGRVLATGSFDNDSRVAELYEPGVGP